MNWFFNPLRFLTPSSDKKNISTPTPVIPITSIIQPAPPQPAVTIGNDYQISTHFTYQMLVITEHRNFIDMNSEHGKKFVKNMVLLCTTVLEPIIQITGEVPTITSCFRCLPLNTAIGGANNSQHTKAEAVDQIFKKITLKDVYNKIMGSKIPYSQLIFEFGSWVHVGVIDNVLYPGKKGQNFVASTVKGKTVYTPITNNI